MTPRLLHRTGGRLPGRTLAGYLVAASAVVACPCHVLLLLPLLAGTVLGGLLTRHLAVVLVGATAYFGVALLAAWWMLQERPVDGPRSGCERCEE